MITLLVGVPLGLMAGRYRDGPWDIGGRLYGIVIYAFPVFFLGFLFQLGRLAIRLADVRARQSDRGVRPGQDHPLLSDRHVAGRRLERVLGRPPAPDPPGPRPRPDDQRRADPPDQGEPPADDAGRLRRGGASARRQRAPGGHQSRLPQRDGPGRHRRRAAVRDPARRRRAHRGDLQLARASAPSSSAT